MKKPIGLGFMGCGGHSTRHAEVVRRMPDKFRIVGAFDKDWSTAAKLAFYSPDHGPNHGSGVATTDLKKFLATEGMDAVLIGTPHKYHLDLCRAALLAGKHILCEKPLWEGERQIEAALILSEAQSRGLVFSSCHLRRYEKEYVHVKKHLRDYKEMFGSPVEVRFQFFYHEPSTGWKMDDSLLLDHMNHEIDLVHFLFGHNQAKFWRISHSFDEYRVTGKTVAGLGIWFSGYRRLKGRTFRNELELVFERGRVRTEVLLNSATGMVSSTVSTFSFEDDSETTTRFRSHSYDDALVGVMNNFAGVIRGEEKCYLTPQDLLTNTTICNDLVANEHGYIERSST